MAYSDNVVVKVLIAAHEYSGTDFQGGRGVTQAGFNCIKGSGTRRAVAVKMMAMFKKFILIST